MRKSPVPSTLEVTNSSERSETQKEALSTATLAVLVRGRDAGEDCPGAGSVAAATDCLLDEAERLGLPLTWSIVDPAASDRVQRILAARPLHELALEYTWPNASLTRERNLGIIYDRLHRAQQSGLQLTTVVSASAVELPALEPLARQGVSLLVTPGRPWQTSPAAVNPGHRALKPDAGQGTALLRHGIRCLSLDARSNSAGWLTSWNESWRRQASWRRLASEGGIAIESLTLASPDENFRTWQQALERRLEAIASARSTLNLSVATLANWDQATRGARRRRSAGSILRRGAA